MLFIAKQDSMMSGNSEFNEAWRWSRNQWSMHVCTFCNWIGIKICSYSLYDRNNELGCAAKIYGKSLSYVKNMNVWNVDRRKRVIPGSRLIIAFHKTSESESRKLKPFKGQLQYTDGDQSRNLNSNYECK